MGERRPSFPILSEHARGGHAAPLPMRNILIPSLATDMHAVVVQVALEQRGHHVVRWTCDELPSLRTSSLTISSQQKLDGWVRWHGRRVRTEEIDLVWLRRPGWPLAPAGANADDGVPGDEARRHWYRSIWEACWAANAAWVNTIQGRHRANNRLVQLNAARECGLAIPDTLISNEPDEVRRFIQSSRVVVKPFQTQDRREGDKRTSMLTASIRERRLPEEALIRACPAIYQMCLPKAFEVRALFCGKAVLAVSFDAQRQTGTPIDWSVGRPDFSIGAKEIVVPLAIKEACFAVMARLGIVTASFDFAVTPSGRWIFDELNEQGPFMGMEQCAPEACVTDMFVRFLEAESHWDFEYSRTETPLRLRELLNAPRTEELTLIDAARVRNQVSSAVL